MECAPLWISATDLQRRPRRHEGTETGFGELIGADFYSLHGQRDEEFLLHVRGRGSYYSSRSPPSPDIYRSHQRIGDEIDINGRTWRCICRLVTPRSTWRFYRARAPRH